MKAGNILAAAIIAVVVYVAIVMVMAVLAPYLAVAVGIWVACLVIIKLSKDPDDE